MLNVKVAIVGSRGLTVTSEDIKAALAEKGWTPTEVVSGGAVGVDKNAEQYARAYNIPTRVFPVVDRNTGRWIKHPLERNTDIAKYADVVLAFWDGQSKGTMDVVGKAEKFGKPVHVVRKGGEGPKERYDATCSKCGEPAYVPFKPRAGGSPILCASCYYANLEAEAQAAKEASLAGKPLGSLDPLLRMNRVELEQELAKVKAERSKLGPWASRGAIDNLDSRVSFIEKRLKREGRLW